MCGLLQGACSTKRQSECVLYFTTPVMQAGNARYKSHRIVVKQVMRTGVRILRCIAICGCSRENYVRDSVYFVPYMKQKRNDRASSLAPTAHAGYAPISLHSLRTCSCDVINSNSNSNSSILSCN